MRKPRVAHHNSTYLIDKSTAVQSGDLTLADIGNLQVRVQQQVERERQLLGWVVHADVEVKLLLPQYDAICDAEAVERMIDCVMCAVGGHQSSGYSRVVPHGASEICVH